MLVRTSGSTGSTGSSSNSLTTSRAEDGRKACSWGHRQGTFSAAHYQQITWSAEACCGFARHTTQPVSPWESKFWACEVPTTCSRTAQDLCTQGSSYPLVLVHSMMVFTVALQYVSNSIEYQLRWRLSVGVQSGTGTLKTTPIYHL